MRLASTWSRRAAVVAMFAAFSISTTRCDCGSTLYGFDGGPDLGPADASPPRDGGSDAGHDAGVDLGTDAGIDGDVDAGLDAGLDAEIDLGADASLDAGTDAAIDGGPTAHYWLFEDVAPVTVDPGGACAYTGTIVGYGFDTTGREVIAWRDSTGCSGAVYPTWARRDPGGAWAQHGIEPGLYYPGGADSDYAHELALSPVDGTPYLFFGAITGEDFYTWRVDLETDPTGASPISAGEYLGNYRYCHDTKYSLAFAPGAPAGPPHWLTSDMGCGANGPLRYDGVDLTPTVVRMFHHDLAIDASGTTHVVYNAYGNIVYQRGTEPPVTLASINLNGQVGGPEIEIDAAGTIYVVVPGWGSWGDLGRGGDLVMLTSTDGGDSFSPPETIDSYPPDPGFPSGFFPTLVLDPSGSPALAYWHGYTQLVYATRDATGTWTHDVVTELSTADSSLRTGLAYDAAGSPRIAFWDWDVRRTRIAYVGTDASHPIDLHVSGTASPRYLPTGVDERMHWSVLNSSDRDATDVVVTVEGGTALPSYTLDPGATSSSGATSTYTLPRLHSGARFDFSLHAGGPATPGNVDVSVTASAAEPDATPGDGMLSQRFTVWEPACFPSASETWWPADGTPEEMLYTTDGYAFGRRAYAPGRIGQAFDLDGVGDYALSSGVYFRGPDARSFTVSAWIATTTLAQQFVFSRYECGGECVGASYYFLELDDTGHLVADLGDVASGTSAVTGARVIADGAFHHVAMVRDVDAATLTIYVDGTPDGSVSLVGGASGPISEEGLDRDPLVMGAKARAGVAGYELFFHGRIDDVRYFERAVDATEMAAVVAAVDDGVSMCVP